MNFVLSEAYSQYKNDILNILKNFKNEGTVVGHGNRNVVKFFIVNDLKFNFKSFKQHNIINRHVYKYYRKSKSRRSYEYAQMLLDKGFFTPKPVAFIENHDWIGVTSSYYVSEQLEDVFTLSDVLHNDDFTDREKIIKAYTNLIFQLHENGIIFIDNASGNFLIKKTGENFQFFLVDLNRMNFYESIDIDKRLINFERLTNDLETIKIISAEYARLSGNSPEFCLNKIVDFTNKKAFKRKVKKILKFYKYFLPKH
ncbi:lipopolysaccharide kinase InaA family protein [Epilithonimonas zeae]|uniref:Lipopolysaccharide kinase (Kdo/WaaP) family protein n=2 Tax=Epilithonimonas TaxID=2782229 RepID=A0A1N6IJM4_9FLAO|nr:MULTISPECIES: lipopolysaccharide kinase InaA family protein [Epilithonimonas]AZI38901.1 lipopolysaccharide kinase [Epilithonimonas vandammei]SIO32222.1 Lipopolysaccharide kinase (Kdo/WaaP) family protein [Epilithonimonas zeae]